MTTYAAFQDYYLRRMWRQGDADLTQDLPSLIREAEARIKRDVRNTDLTSVLEVAVTEGAVPLPGDFREVLSFKALQDDCLPMTFVPPNEFSAYNTNSSGNRAGLNKVASVFNNNINFVSNATVEDPTNLELIYYLGITPYETDPATPFYDLHPDFFLAAVDIQYYTYIRDFALANEFKGTYQEIWSSLETDSNYRMFPSGNLDARPAGEVW